MKFPICVVLALVVASDAFLNVLVPETPQDLLLPVSLRSLQWYKRLRQKSPRKQIPVRRTKATKVFKRQDLQRLAQQQQQPAELPVPLEERMPTVIEQPVQVESDSGCLLRTIIINGIVVKRRECFGRDGRIKMDLLEIDTLGQSKGAQQMLRLGVSRPLSMMEAVEIHALLKDSAPGLSPKDIQSGFNGPPANFPTKLVKVLLDFLKMQVQRMRGGGPGTRPLQPGGPALNPGRDGTQSIGQPNVPGQQEGGQMPRDMTPSPTPSPRTSAPTEPATPSSPPPTTTEMTNRGPPDTPPPSEDIGNAPEFPPNFGLASQPSLGAFPTAMLQIFQSLSLILFGAVGISLSLVAPNIFNEIFKFNDFVLYNVNGTLNVAQDVIKANLPTTVGTTTTSTTMTEGGESAPTVTSPGPITVITPIVSPSMDGQDVLTPITRDGTTETSNLRDNRTKSRPLMDRLIKLLFWKQK